MSPGALIDIEAGTLKNGGWASTIWTNNQASMYIASGGTFDIWNGITVYIDALNGSGTIKCGSGGPGPMYIGVANGSGTFSGNVIFDQDNVTLIKVGTGTQAFNGTMNSSSTFQVQDGILTGTGNVGQLVLTGGTVAPGASAAAP